MRKLAAICLLLLAGCASAPVASPGPMLPKGPLHGRLEQGVYHDMRGWFGVVAPIAATDSAYATLGVNEDYQANVSFVSFFPTTAPGEYYRVYVEDFYATNHPVTGLSQIADSAMKLFGRQVVQARTEPIQMVEEKPWTAGATSGLLRFYTERTPMESMLTNLGMAEDYTAYILMYVTVDHGKVAILWVEWPMGCKYCEPLPMGPTPKDDDPIDKALAADARSSAFMASFHFGND